MTTGVMSGAAEPRSVGVKVCGVTTAQDAEACAAAGATMIGFNFYPRSRRHITPALAREIGRRLPREVGRVGVFVNEDAEAVRQAACGARLDAVQLHGDETPAYCRELRALLPASCRVIRALRIGADFALEDASAFGADALLVDAFAPDSYGGTGRTLDWSLARRVRVRVPDLILAGGLTPENVGRAVRCVRPAAVDVCSGVEREPGRKDLARVAEFVRAVRGAELETGNEIAEGGR